MFENFIMFLLAIVGLAIIFILLSLLGSLYFKHYYKKNTDINEKYFFEREEIKNQAKKIRKIENDYHDKIKILKNFCTTKEDFMKFYDKYKIYDIAETLMQERDNLNDYKEIFKNKLSKREKDVLWEYIGNTHVDLKINECEDIILRYNFYKDCN